jgi:hypothetical protein
MSTSLLYHAFGIRGYKYEPRVPSQTCIAKRRASTRSHRRTRKRQRGLR